MVASVDDEGALVLRPLCEQFQRVVRSQAEGRCGNIAARSVCGSLSVRLGVPSGEVPTVSREAVIGKLEILRGVIAGGIRGSAGGVFRVLVVSDGKGVDAPVGGVHAVANAARRNGDAHGCAIDLRTAPTGEGVTGLGGIDQRDGVGFNGIAGRVRTGYDTVIQRVADGVGNHIPLSSEGHIAEAAGCDLSDGRVLCPAAGGVRGHFPAREGVAASADVIRGGKSDRFGLNIIGDVRNVGTAVFVQRGGVVNRLPLGGRRIGDIRCRAEGVDCAVNGTVGAGVERPAGEGVAVSGGRCKLSSGVVVPFHRRCAGVGAAVGVDGQGAAIDLPQSKQRHIAGLAGQCRTLGNSRVLGPASVGIGGHLPVQEGIAGLDGHRKGICAFNGIGNGFQGIAAVRVEGDGVVICDPLCGQGHIAELAGRRCGGSLVNGLLRRPVAAGHGHFPAVEAVARAGQRGQCRRMLNIISGSGGSLVCAVGAAGIVEGCRIGNRFIVRGQRIVLIMVRAEGVLLRFGIEGTVLIAAEGPGGEAVAVVCHRIQHRVFRAGALGHRRVRLTVIQSVGTGADGQGAGVLRPVGIQGRISGFTGVEIVDDGAVGLNVLRAETASLLEVADEGVAGLFRRDDLRQSGFMGRVGEVGFGIEGVIDRSGVLGRCALSVQRDRDAVRRPFCIEGRGRGDRRVRIVDECAVSIQIHCAAAIGLGEVTAEGVAIAGRRNDGSDLVGLFKVVIVLASGVGVIHSRCTRRCSILIVKGQNDAVRRGGSGPFLIPGAHRTGGLLVCRSVGTGPRRPGVACGHNRVNGEGGSILVGTCAADTRDAGAGVQGHGIGISGVVVFNHRTAVGSDCHRDLCGCSEAFIFHRIGRDRRIGQRREGLFLGQRVGIAVQVLFIMLDRVSHFGLFPLRKEGDVRSRRVISADLVFECRLSEPAPERIAHAVGDRVSKGDRNRCPLCCQGDIAVAGEGHILSVAVGHIVGILPTAEDIGCRL